MNSIKKFINKKNKILNVNNIFLIIVLLIILVLISILDSNNSYNNIIESQLPFDQLLELSDQGGKKGKKIMCTHNGCAMSIILDKSIEKKNEMRNKIKNDNENKNENENR